MMNDEFGIHPSSLRINHFDFDCPLPNLLIPEPGGRDSEPASLIL